MQIYSVLCKHRCSGHSAHTHTHTHTCTGDWLVHVRQISVNCWISDERALLIEDNRKINPTFPSVWRGGLFSRRQSRSPSRTRTSLRLCVSIPPLLLRSRPLSHILCLVVSLLTVWWRRSWKHRRHRHTRTHACQKRYMDFCVGLSTSQRFRLLKYVVTHCGHFGCLRLLAIPLHAVYLSHRPSVPLPVN